MTWRMNKKKERKKKSYYKKQKNKREREKKREKVLMTRCHGNNPTWPPKATILVVIDI